MHPPEAPSRCKAPQTACLRVHAPIQWRFDVPMPPPIHPTYWLQTDKRNDFRALLFRQDINPDSLKAAWCDPEFEQSEPPGLGLRLIFLGAVWWPWDMGLPDAGGSAACAVWYIEHSKTLPTS